MVIHMLENGFLFDGELGCFYRGEKPDKAPIVKPLTAHALQLERSSPSTPGCHDKLLLRAAHLLLQMH